MIKDCIYCRDILKTDVDTINKPWNRIIYETPNFVLVPSVGGFIKGWVLVISKRHVTSMGALSLAESIELKELVNEVRDQIRECYGSAIVFEHGPSCEGTTFGCGIDHGHFHIVPFEKRVIPLINKYLEKSPNWELLQDISDLKYFYKNDLSYLYLRENNDNNSYVSCLPSIPSQLIRRVLATDHDLSPFYDYRKFKFESNAVLTGKRLTSIFKSKILVGI